MFAPKREIGTVWSKVTEAQLVKFEQLQKWLALLRSSA
jgi:hypothetical protein